MMQKILVRWALIGNRRMSDSKLPGIDSTVETYLDAWDIFEKKEFNVEELWKDLMSRSSDVDSVPEESTLDSRLYRAAAFGLADWYGDSTYRLRIGPNEDDEEWKAQAHKHMQEIKEQIQMAYQDRKENRNQSDDGLSTDEYDGDVYVRSDVGPDTDLEGQARFYNAVLNQTEDHSGIVLRCFPQVWKEVEELAEEITDDEKMEDAGCMYRFERVGADLVPVDDDQEYRIYLRETRFLND